MSRRVFKYLDLAGKEIVKKAKANLSKKSASGKLLNSIDYKVVTTNEGYAVQFSMADHGKFVDKGVSGTKTRRMSWNIVDNKLIKKKSLFSYKRGVGNSPNIGALEKWISKKGIKGRDDLGRFIKTKSLAYLFSKSIQREGLKGTGFFTKSVFNEIQNIPEGLAYAFAEDVREDIRELKK